MKKSEMVKALADNFCHVYEIEIHAETIIDFLESKGVLPPAYETRTKSGICKVILHEWEDEKNE